MRKIIILTIIFLSAINNINATSIISSNGTLNTIDEDSIRINVIIESDSSIIEQKHSEYSFINLAHNKIIYNQTDSIWSNFFSKLSKSASQQISILHIGDSHLQADIATGKTRVLLQNRFGDAGRGIISPLKIAKTNQPVDYSFSCSNKYTYSSMMKRPWRTTLKLTGASFSPSSEKFNINISSGSKTIESQPFTILRLHIEGDLYIDEVIVNSIPLQCDIDYTIEESQPDHTDIIFSKPVTQANLSLSSIGKITIFGASLLNNNNGVIYNVIGNNGATYDSYNRMGDMGNDCSIFSPDLIIVSLGTNEAFGSISDESFYNSIDKFVTDMQASNPNKPILLVTPMECLRKGQINTNCKRLRDVILTYGVENNIAVYDWYEVAGGLGASKNWVSNKLMGKDGIHNTSKGYTLQGNLFYEILINEVK